MVTTRIPPLLQPMAAELRTHASKCSAYQCREADVKIGAGRKRCDCQVNPCAMQDCTPMCDAGGEGSVELLEISD